MRIIDLAKKQKNNEILPKHIRYYNKDLYFDGVTYYDKEGNNDLFDILAINNNALTHLYDKVEIIEEEEIPEKLEEDFNQHCNEYLYKKVEDKINSIIDYLKSKEKGE